MLTTRGDATEPDRLFSVIVLGDYTFIGGEATHDVSPAAAPLLLACSEFADAFHKQFRLESRVLARCRIDY